MAHYNKKQVVEALKKAGLENGDIVFSHNNIGFFGLPEEGKTPQIIFELLLDAFFEVIGDSGTLILPTFTYSFPKGEVFDVQNSPGIGGFFSEMLRKHPEAIRSVDPSVSVAAIGSKAKVMTENMPQNSYARDGIFGRLLKYDAKVCNMNMDIATTMIHYAEKIADVPYRFLKTFKGEIRNKGVTIEAENSIFVHYKIDGLQESFEPFDQLANERGLVKKVNVGRGFINVMSVKDQVELVLDHLESSPWFLTKAGITGMIPDTKLFTEEYK